MLLTRTREDVLRAYKVYKCMDLIKRRTNEKDATLFTLISAFVALYDGVSTKELEEILPVSRSCLKDVIKKGVYNFNIFNYDGNLALGRTNLTKHVYKGVLTLSQSMKDMIKSNTKVVSVPDIELKAFATLLSNSSSHVIIMRDNIEHAGGKEILQHLHALFTSIVNHNLYSGCSYAKNLAHLGYMAPVNGDVIVNKNAVMYNKEPKFELQTV